MSDREEWLSMGKMLGLFSVWVPRVLNFRVYDEGPLCFGV